jgi:predicted dehydrogenase
MTTIVQVGCGRWGTSWAQEILPTVSGVTVRGFVDGDRDALERMQQALQVPASMCFTSLTAALSACPCDIVLVTVRTAAHFDVVDEALRAGRHVIVEKPFASSLAEARDLNELARQRNLHLMVSQNYRHYRAPRTAANAVAQKTFGQLLQVQIDFRRNKHPMGYYDIANPLLADLSIHHFDLMRMVIGREPLRVSCLTWNPQGSPYTDDPAGVATIEFEGGLIVSYRASWVSTGSNTPWSGTWVMECEAGEMVWGCRADVGFERSSVDHIMFRPRNGEPAPLDRVELSYFDRAGTIATLKNVIETGVIPDYFSSGEDNIKSLALVEACIASARSGGAWLALSDVLRA